MEILIILAALVAIGAIWYFNRGQKLDANNDGKVNLADVGAFIDNTAKGVARVADANKDGKVDAKDAKAVVKKAAVKAKATAKRVSSTAKRAPAKKK
jgi:hypothetical protein